MTEPELLASGTERRLPPVARRALPVAVTLALLGALIVLAVHSSARRAPAHRDVRPVTTPVALPSTGPAGPATPIAADLARVVVDPARHRLRLIFTVFNDQTTRVVVVRAGRDSAGLSLRSRSVARFAASGSWQAVRLPLALEGAQSAHITLDYGVRRCPASDDGTLQVPAVLATRERGLISLDLAALIPPRDWPRGLISVLCPISSR